MKTFYFLIGFVLAFAGCTEVKEGTKETLNRGGKAIGESASEFIKGVSEGVERTLECKLLLSDELKEKGMSTGKFSIKNQSSGEDNVLVVYFIFDQGFKGTLRAQVFGKDGLEVGRAVTKAKAESGEAMYLDFTFDDRTQIESQSEIHIQEV